MIIDRASMMILVWPTLLVCVFAHLFPCNMYAVCTLCLCAHMCWWYLHAHPTYTLRTFLRVRGSKSHLECSTRACELIPFIFAYVAVQLGMRRAAQWHLHESLIWLKHDLVLVDFTNFIPHNKRSWSVFAYFAVCLGVRRDCTVTYAWKPVLVLIKDCPGEKGT